jgi:transposase
MAHLEPARVTVGVDTHKHVHVAAARDQLGRRLGVTMAPATRAGYVELLAWARGLGEVQALGVEGTGSYGAGLVRFLAAHGQRVLEVNRPDRAARRRRFGKSDPVDADAAARTVQAGEATGIPKAQDGTVEMTRALRVARQTAVKARTQAVNAIKALLVTAPTELRDRLDGLPTTRLVRQAAALDPGEVATPTAACMLAVRSLAQRYQQLGAEIQLLTGSWTGSPSGMRRPCAPLLGVGPEVAAELLVCAGDNPARLGSEAAFAALCGTSPVEASSGKTRRHRLNRGGDRHANAALHRIVIVRLRYHQPTRDYMTTRLAQGKTKKEIIRCLKRYVAREVFAVLHQLHHDNITPAA